MVGSEDGAATSYSCSSEKMGSVGVVVSAGLRLLVADGNDDGRGGSDCIVKLLDSWSAQARDTQHLTELHSVICVD